MLSLGRVERVRKCTVIGRLSNTVTCFVFEQGNDICSLCENIGRGIPEEFVDRYDSDPLNLPLFSFSFFFSNNDFQVSRKIYDWTEMLNIRFKQHVRKVEM